MKLLVKQSATSVKASVFIQDSSSTVGAGLGGLVFNTSGLTAYYYREGDASSTAITLVTMTLGTWTSSGFIVVDGTNMKGMYQLGLPNACFSNLGSVVVYLQGATNMAPCVLEIQVVAFDPTDATRMGLSALPNAAASASGGLLTFGTGTGQVNPTSGKVPATLASTDVTGNVSSNVLTWNGTSVGTIPPDAVFIHSGTAQSGSTSSTIKLDSGASGTDNLYQNQIVFIRSGTGAGESAIIASYVAGTKVATIQGTWATTPDATSVFSILPFGTLGTVSANVTQWNTFSVPGTAIHGIPDINVLYWSGHLAIADGNNYPSVNVVDIQGSNSVGTAGYFGIDWASIANKTSTNALTNTTISSTQSVANVTIGGYASGQDPATLVLDVSASLHNTAGTIGAKINAGGSAGDPWSTALPGAYASGTAGNIVGNNLNASVGSRMATFTLPTNFSSLSIDVSGRMDLGKVLGTASTGAAGYVGVDWGALTNKTTTNALTGTTISTSQTITSVSGSVGSVTGNVGGNVVGSVASVTGNVGGNVVGSVGSVTGNVNGNLVGTIGGYASGQDPATLVLDVAASLHNTPGTIGSKINASGSSADPWTTLLPGSYTTGQAGYIVGHNLDTNTASRMASFTLPTNFSSLAITPSGYTTVGSYASGQDPATLVLDVSASLHNLPGSIGGKINSAAAAGDPWTADIPGTYMAGQAGFIVGTNLDAKVSSRMATFALPPNFTNLSVDANGRVEIQSGITRNVALLNFEFPMVLSRDHFSPAIGLGNTVVAEKSQDGAPYVPCDNPVREVGNGTYAIDLSANDMNAGIVKLLFSAPTTDDVDVVIRTTP
jgi:hypothetical protein